MLSRLAVLLTAVVALGAIDGVRAAAAPAATPSCAPLASNPQAPPSPSPGTPCWAATNPYPFGYDGGPVNPNSRACQDYAEVQTGVRLRTYACYLIVRSMIFRAWNRGLAVVRSPFGPTPYGVWVFDGIRWSPNAAFPGSTVCKGDRIVWAGKRDYWLVGDNLCRFDAVNYQWEPFSIPRAAVAEAQQAEQAQGSIPQPVTITGGSCSAWNDCWFFGWAPNAGPRIASGIELHWDGQTLNNATGGLAGSSWQRPDFSAAASAGRVGIAVTRSPSGQPNQPNGPAPAQLYRSAGGPFEPSSVTLPNDGSGTSWPTDLVAVALNGAGQGWIAGMPPPLNQSSTRAPAPLIPVPPAGGSRPCAGPAPDTFMYGRGSDSSAPQYAWSSISVEPDGSALAGGSRTPDSTGRTVGQPLIAQVSCDQPPVLDVLQTDGQMGGEIDAVAANADNDAWAAGTITIPDPGGDVSPRSLPVLYHLTDTTPPHAPAGNDRETRYTALPPQPKIYSFPPPPKVVRRKPPTVSKTKPKPVHVLAPIFDVHAGLVNPSPGVYLLRITFKVRRKVVLGAVALLHGRVVSATGLRPFRPKRGVLTLRLNPSAWPKQVEFEQPPPAWGSGA